MMPAHGDTAGPGQFLRAIQGLLTPPGDQVPPAALDVMRMRDDLLRPERRIIVIGAFKTGKSALVNALLAAPIVPVRAQQPSRRIAEIGFGEAPEAWVRRLDGGTDEVQFDALREAILAGPVTDTVQIRVPAPLLAPNCIFVDTPGFGEDPATNEAILAAERADLAIVVLAADKILSATERAAAAEIGALLGGNVVYAVNRLDLIDPEDRSEVLEWALAVLAGSGNALVGTPRIFGTVARGGTEAKVQELRSWLSQAQASGLLDRIGAVSRLCRLQRAATDAATVLGIDAAAARTTADEARRRHEERLARERTQLAQVMNAARTALEGLLLQVLEAEERFVLRSVEDTAARLRIDRGVVPLQVRGAIDALVGDVTSSVRDALMGVPVSAPIFSLEDWIVRIQVEPARDTPDAIGGDVGEALTRIFDGGKAGRETGTAIGGWIGKTVLGVDAEGQRRKRIERAARSVLPSLRTEIERYLAQVVVLLDEAERYYTAREQPDPRVATAVEEAERAAALFHWAGTLVQEAGALRARLAG